MRRLKVPDSWWSSPDGSLWWEMYPVSRWDRLVMRFTPRRRFRVRNVRYTRMEPPR